MKLENGGRCRPESASGVRKAPQKPGACELTWPAARASKAERPEAAKERDEARGVSSSNFLAGLIAALHRPGCNEAPGSANRTCTPRRFSEAGPMNRGGLERKLGFSTLFSTVDSALTSLQALGAPSSVGRRLNDA